MYQLRVTSLHHVELSALSRIDALFGTHGFNLMVLVIKHRNVKPGIFKVILRTLKPIKVKIRHGIVTFLNRVLSLDRAVQILC